ncbi:bifunctional dTDP-4-dehydrorhamnose 3,5-epimerase family protein/NAD(P)-dependent oxidoreductase [Leucobacter sp. CSA1]|uniref:dTDP-4-dehydrorhamnose reductase n=1 Tax=Leucobacter chromiisoli TaxID=2796471 RepID=A0A934UTG0_9MICO|nr:bifunctional dTDP-4-dehydrorhamnose 3,5-epimerase family protein/NAD(P)-dependent oxidoreductase [Leucobacter chromiisoli]MBK0417665.1 bifunctional dTDP-4-dehydrorhamnose 3,5-epimerase family protein/NAD(P)-dependent oxidoreductase [Leucobacter chromiisoli]
MAAKQLALRETTIPGLVLLDLPVHGDNRGWFKENWQREKMVALGLPDFGPVQNNISFNDKTGATRGIHAEPWDKFVSVATGKIFGAWVDLREGDSFGAVFTAELDPSTAIFVPRGVGNSYQTLADDTAYVYLVNDHWSAEAQGEYTFLNLEDETAAIDWPIPLDRAERSEKDLAHPRLADVVPMKPKRTLVIGANGQLGTALRSALPDADFAARDRVDLASAAPFDGIRWADYDTVVNAAAYTKVDEAETETGRRDAWAANVAGVAALARAAVEHGLTLVHVSSDYVFDGTEQSYAETDACSPLGVYGQTKAAGDAIVSTVPRHYIVRTSWVIGEGGNFVRTMASLAERGIDPSVVDDQVGRLSFTDDIAAGIRHLLETRPEHGVYNLTNEGPSMSWCEIAKLVYEGTGHDPARVSGVSTEEYFAGKRVAPRPLNSTLELGKLEAAGFTPRDAREALTAYLAEA